MPGTVQHKTEITTVGTASCVSTLCLPDVTTCDQISKTFPLSICTASDKTMEVGTAWERGYSN